MLCEPTAGVDIGARHAIYDFVAEQVRLGLSVIVASSDVGDLLALCTRILVLKDGVVAGRCRRRVSPSTNSYTPWKDWRARRREPTTAPRPDADTTDAKR